jgi:hypothetical protein
MICSLKAELTADSSADYQRLITNEVGLLISKLYYDAIQVRTA